MWIPEPIPESAKLFHLKGLGEAGLGHVLLSVVDEHVYNLIEVTGLVPNAELIVGRGAAVKYRVDVLDFLAGTERVEYIIDEIEQLADQVFNGHFFLLPQI